MKLPFSLFQRAIRFASQRPEIRRNARRFKVRFILPRWFKVPTRVFINGAFIPLTAPEQDNLDADFIECFLRNAYGLGHRLDEVRTILDIGAHAGFFSLAARDHYHRATIHAYEPNPRILPTLRANTSGTEIRIFAEAVGESEGSVTIVDAGPSDEARTTTQPRDGETIPQICIATAIERIGGSVDLLKLNCEGAEFGILQPNPVWLNVRDIRMEYHLFDERTFDEMNAAIKAIGFRIVYLQTHHEDAGMIWATRA